MKTLIKLMQNIQRYFARTIQNQAGVVLPIILMAIGGLSLLGAAAVGVATGEIGIANNDKIYKSALNLAEAGVADAADGLQGNRDLLPQPVGAVSALTYTFSTALASGRYHVTVTLPYIKNITSTALAGASSVVVSNTSNLGVGDIVIIGNTTIHMMARIGSISGTTLNLQDSQGNPFSLLYDVDSSMYLAKNVVRVTSVGQSGTGLTGAYAMNAWRNSPANLTNTAVPSTGVVRSTATLQGEYTMQEIQFMDSFVAQVNNPGNRFNGPMLVTSSLSVYSYSQNDFSGPIFKTTSATADFYAGPPSSPGTRLTSPITPKIVSIPNVSTNGAAMINQAKTNATCYQTQCSNASGTQQIYYLNGYDIQVKAYHPNGAGTPNFPFSIGDNYYYDDTYVYFSIVIKTTVTPTSADNMSINFNFNETPTATDMATSGNIAPNNAWLLSASPSSYTTGTPAAISMNSTGTNLTFKNGNTYNAGTVINLKVAKSAIPATGSYMRMYDNSSNVPGFTGSEAWTNGIWVTPLGDIMSEERQGNAVLYTDGAAGSHTAHATVLTTAPTKEARGSYLSTSDTVLSSNTWVTAKGAVLFGGKRVSDGRLPGGTTISPWVIGESAVYYTTYNIHTNASGSCNDHDISVTSKTIVTYLGTAQTCGTEVKRLYMYETIWNHGSNNTYNYQVQDNDTEATNLHTNRKGYYRWIKTKDITENEPMTVTALMGDEEFNSMFNHSANSRFHSAAVNVNISNIRMIGWANPPMIFDSASSTMIASRSEFPDTTAWLPANITSWDLQDMAGIYSSFLTTPEQRGFDFTGFTLETDANPTGNIHLFTNSAGQTFLPDVSLVPGSPRTTIPRTGTGNVTLYRYNSGAWSNSGITVPMPGNSLMPRNTYSSQQTRITATISGPYFTSFQVKSGTANLFFDPANGIPFNISQLSVETKGAGANITIGSQSNPAAVFAGTFSLQSEDCGGTVNFGFVGKMVSSRVELENNVQYNMDTTISNAASCLSSGQSFIYLRKSGWKEVR